MHTREPFVVFVELFFGLAFSLDIFNDQESMPESFKNDTAEANAHTIIQKKQWRRSFWRGVEKAGSTYLQGEMMRADGDAVPTFNYLSASPDKGFDATKHLRAEELSDDCNDRWSFVHKGRGFEVKTDCEKPKYLVALNNGDGPGAFHDAPYPGPEGKWNIFFAKPPPPEPPANEEPVVELPKDVPLEVEEEAAKDPESSGAALEMVEEGDAQKAVENLSNPAWHANPIPESKRQKGAVTAVTGKNFQVLIRFHAHFSNIVFCTIFCTYLYHHSYHVVFASTKCDSPQIIQWF